MKSIELTNEQWEKLQSGEDVTLKAPEVEWEPKGVPYQWGYYCVDEHGDVQHWPNSHSTYDHSLAQCGNMSAEKWQAEEIAKRNRANNRIAQYVFEHMKDGEYSNYTVRFTKNPCGWVVCDSCCPTDVLMPERVAKMLCGGINSGRVQL